MRSLLSVLFVAVLGLPVLGCNSKPPPPNPFDTPPKATKEPPPLKEPPKIVGAPDIVIDNQGPKVGFTRVLIERNDGREKLAEALAEHKQHWQEKSATVRVDRRAKPEWLAAMIDELASSGASKVIVKSDTRADFPKELTFAPQSKVGALPACTVATMVLADRGTATWKISGGTASKRARGFAGPDLATTADTLVRMGKACKDSNKLLLGGAEGVEWGLLYDLAASSQKLDGVTYEEIVLLRERPIAGRKVEISG
jgi:hypothetical protein